jgi:hypothetical protein
MRIRKSTTVLAALVAALALSGAAATGIALASPPGASPIAQAAAKTSQAGSFRLSFDLAFSVSGGTSSVPAGPFSLTGQGAFDTRHSTGQLSLNLGALGALLGAATGGAKVPSAIDVVILKTALYMHYPALAQQLSPGKEWLRFDLAKLPRSATGGVSPGQLKQVNPQQLITALQSAVSTSKVGTETVRGVSTTHYRAVIDMTKVVSALPASQRAATLKSLRQAGLSKLPVDAWIDGSNYLRRLAVSTRVKSSGSAVTLKLLTELYDYGAKVKVSAPPASKVTDGTVLLNQLIAAAGISPTK